MKRFLTAIIGMPLALGLVIYGNALFTATVVLLALLSLGEMATMLRRCDIKISVSLASVGITLLILIAWMGNTQEYLFTILIILFGLVLRLIFHYDSFSFPDAVMSFYSFLYIGFTLSHLVLLRFIDSSATVHTIWGNISSGVLLVTMILLGTWVNDTFAYLIGTWRGRHKLCVKVSPGKTWEGFAGGFCGTVAVFYAIAILLHTSVLHFLVLSIIVGVIGPAGDLAESVLKRYAGVKDSGTIIPGHGGILDRLDSLMFSIPFVYYYVQIFMING